MADPTQHPAGYIHLWDRLIDHARRELLLAQPAGVAAVERLHLVKAFMTGDLEDAYAAAARLAKEHRVVLRGRTRRAIEFGVAAYDSARKLDLAQTRLARIKAGRDYSSPDDVDAALDLWWIYLHRQIESATKFISETAGVLGGGDARASAVLNAAEWEKVRTNAIAKGRQEVAHGTSAFIAGIAEERWWEPMIIHGVTQGETIDEMIIPRESSMRRRLELWGRTSSA